MRRTVTTMDPLPTMALVIVAALLSVYGSDADRIETVAPCAPCLAKTANGRVAVVRAALPTRTPVY